MLRNVYILANTGNDQNQPVLIEYKRYEEKKTKIRNRTGELFWHNNSIISRIGEYSVALQCINNHKSQ